MRGQLGRWKRPVTIRWTSSLERETFRRRSPCWCLCIDADTAAGSRAWDEREDTEAACRQAGRRGTGCRTAAHTDRRRSREKTGWTVGSATSQGQQSRLQGRAPLIQSLHALEGSLTLEWAQVIILPHEIIIMKLVHWPMMGGWLHLVQRGGDWAPNFNVKRYMTFSHTQLIRHKVL